MAELTLKSDGRLKDSKPLNALKVAELRLKGLSWSQVGNALGYNGSYCHRVYLKFVALLPDPGILEAYNSNRVNLLSALELKILEYMNQETKLKAASFNNLGYGLGQVSNLRRLESDQTTANIGVGVEVRLAKALDRSKDA